MQSACNWSQSLKRPARCPCLSARPSRENLRGAVSVTGGTVRIESGIAESWEQQPNQRLGDPLLVSVTRPSAVGRQQTVHLGARQGPDGFGGGRCRESFPKRPLARENGGELG